MANKNQTYLAKRGLKTLNNATTGAKGTPGTIAKIEHGKYAFQEPQVAMDRKRDKGSRTWKINKVHPNNIAIGKR